MRPDSINATQGRRVWLLISCGIVLIAAAVSSGLLSNAGRVIANWLVSEPANFQFVADPATPPFSREELAKIEHQISDECLAFVARRENLEARRRLLLKDIWKNSDPLPRWLPSKRLDNHPPPNDRIAAVENLSRVLHYKIDIGHGFDSVVRYIRPIREETRQNRLMIVHQGHGALGENGTDTTVLRFLGSGFDVLYCDMPMSGENHFPDETVRIEGCGHSGMAKLQTEKFNPLELFFNHLPTGIELAKAANGKGFEDISMCGISGGAWTTTVYAALDPRIRFSFPVSGSSPHILRTDGGVSGYEGGAHQSIVKICPTYLLYILAVQSFPQAGDMASTGQRGQVQCYNAHDGILPIPLEHYAYPLKYSPGVKAACVKIGGLFSVSVDFRQHQHRLGRFHVELMLKALHGDYEQVF